MRAFVGCRNALTASLLHSRTPLTDLRDQCSFPKVLASRYRLGIVLATANVNSFEEIHHTDKEAPSNLKAGTRYPTEVGKSVLDSSDKPAFMIFFND